MIVQIERTRGGFRFTFPDGARGQIRYRNKGEQDWWDRGYAKSVKDAAKAVYCPFTPRRNIRFKHIN